MVIIASTQEVSWAGKGYFPQIPSTVWWGVREILRRSPSATIDERILAIQIGVQETAAQTYLRELKHIGIIGDDNKSTEIANK